MTAETRPPIRISNRHCCVPTSTSSHIVHGFIVKRLDSWIAQSWEIMRTHFVPVAWTCGGGGQCNWPGLFIVEERLWWCLTGLGWVAVVNSVDIQDKLLKSQSPWKVISLACGSSCGAPRVVCRREVIAARLGPSRALLCVSTGHFNNDGLDDLL